MTKKTKSDDRVTSIAVANYLLEKAKAEGKNLTPLQLIKLVYLCHGWHLAFDRGPLLVDPPLAWRDGPIVPSMYYALRHFGNTPVKGPIEEGYGPIVMPNTSQTQVIDAVFDAYKHMSASALSALTHQPNTPWDKVWSAKGGNAVIPDELIEPHFKEMRNAG